MFRNASLFFLTLVTFSLTTLYAGPLDEAKKRYDEKSYQLANDRYFNAINSGELKGDELREARYMLGMAQMKLGNGPANQQTFEALLKDNADDVWAGRAMWRLAADPGNYGYYMRDDRNTTDLIKALRQADEVLTMNKAADIADYYKDVLVNVMGRYHVPDEKDRAYVFSYFDKIAPELKTDEVRADILLRKADNVAYVRGAYEPDERVKALELVVREFPNTKSAPKAQLNIGTDSMNRRGDFVAALRQFEELKERWPQSDEAKPAREYVIQIRQEQVQFYLGPTYLPDEDIKFLLTARNVGEVVIKAYPFDPSRVLRDKRDVRFDLAAIVEGSSPVHSQTVAVTRRDDYKATTASVELNFHKPGCYVLQAQAGKGVQRCLLLISDLMLVANTGNQGIEFWAVEAKTGKPRPGVRMVVATNAESRKILFSKKEKTEFTKFTDLRSDESGFADYKNEERRWSQLFAVGTDGEHYAFFDNLYMNYYHRDEQPQTYIYTDRPVYRPKQKVNWRAILRTRSGGEFQNVAGRKYYAEIYDARNNVVQRYEDVEANEFGAISGELTLGEQPPLGAYRINISTSDRKTHMGSESFRVEEYKKPEFDVKVTVSDKLFRTGSKVKAEVNAVYYFGSPVADAEIKYTVRRRQHWFPWWRPSFGRDDDLGWFNQDPPDQGPRHGSAGDIVATGSGRTTDDGKYQLEFTAVVPPETEQDKQPYYRRYWWRPEARAFDFQIEFTVTDKSRRNIDGSKTVIVSDKALQLSVGAQQHLYTPGDLVKAELRSRNFNDDPVATKGTLYVERVEWLEEAKKEKVTTISTQRVDVDASGSLITNYRIPKEEAGRLRFLFTADDPFGGKASAYGDFWVASNDSRDILYKYQGVELITGKDIYAVGDTARVMVNCEYRDTQAWYWIDSGSGNLEKKVIPLKDRTNFIQIPITDAFVPNTILHIVAVRNKQVISDQKEIIVPPRKKVLSVTVAADAETYKPGAEGTVRITATDYEGKPAKAEFSLAMFDSSILYIAGDDRVDIRRAFYGSRRPISSNIVNSVAAPSGYNDRLPQGGDWFLQSRDVNLFQYAGRGGRGDYFFGDMVAYDKGGVAAGRTELSMSRSLGFPIAAAAPASAAMEMEGRFAGVAKLEAKAKMKVGELDDKDQLAEQPMVEATTRTDFRDSMFWSPTIATDADGKATAKVKFPDSLTTWKAVAVGTTADTRVGNASMDTVVRKNLLVRLESPRFLRERDKVTLSGIVHNYLSSEKSVRVRLTAEGIDSDGAKLEQTINVAANKETRVDFPMLARQWGNAKLKIEALTNEESDAMELNLPVLPHGIDKMVAWNGSSDDASTHGQKVTTTTDRTTIVQDVEVPAERIHGSTKLTVLVQPSLASAIRDAIPYLVDYPYGCVEQTMSRFLPAAVVAETFRKLNIPRDMLLEAKLKVVMQAGEERLRDFQRSDGGWGWWRDDSPNPYITALVMHGLTIAREAGVSINGDMFNRGLGALQKNVKDFDYKSDSAGYYWYNNSLHTLAFEVFVLALNNQQEPKALDYVWDNREKLTPQALAMLARAMWRVNRQEDSRVCLRNLYNFAVINEENQTARWGRVDRAWYWWDDAVEATAQGLMACLEIEPANPMAQRAMKWLVLNRRGAQWKSTKDTGLAVMALAAYIKDRKESVSDMKIEVKVGDLATKTYDLNADNFWKFDGKLEFEGDAVPDGKFPVTITRTGKGTLFYSVFADYFTLEEGIKSAGNEIFVERKYEKLVRKSVETTTGVVAVDTYVPVSDGETVLSGDELRVTLKIKSLNDYEYLVFEDAKPAGMEPVALQSGSVYAGFCSNMELRDQFVSFFVTHMPQGEHTVTYNCRAEIPGVFHTMPTKGYAMYFPILRANSSEIVIDVKDAPEAKP
ncbi:MAG: hypothetical protein K1X53_00725 [Candidatus Sumerlaeaceae bacterium]|nr:hypothetical protein [Candidatus Sumerlaeaceae bacterium]